MTFEAWVAQYPKLDATKLARRAMKEVPELLVPVVADRVEHVRRSFVRSEEREAMAGFTRALGEYLVPVTLRDRAAAGFSFPSGTFALGDGVKVEWGRATIEQHRQRVAMLQAIVDGTVATIRLHEAAIEALEKSGARCLDEVGISDAA